MTIMRGPCYGRASRVQRLQRRIGQGGRIGEHRRGEQRPQRAKADEAFDVRVNKHSTQVDRLKDHLDEATLVACRKGRHFERVRARAAIDAVGRIQRARVCLIKLAQNAFCLSVTNDLRWDAWLVDCLLIAGLMDCCLGERVGS